MPTTMGTAPMVEGAHAFPLRLKGLREVGKLTGPPAPIVWRAECPTLLGPGVIDTIAATAGWTSEQDNAEGQRVMNVLREVGVRTNCLTIGVDHFGKVIESGTRGGSAKEAASDFVLALLGTRDLNGKVSDCKLAVRKMRDGDSGFEIPFEAKLVEMSDTYGNTKTTRVIEWQTEPVAGGTPTAQWTRPTLILRQAMETTIVEHGERLRPFGAQGEEVIAIDKETVRKEFYVTVNVESRGTTKTKSSIQDAKLKAFKRAVDTAHGSGLINLRDVGGRTMMWVVRGAKPQPAQTDIHEEV